MSMKIEVTLIQEAFTVSIREALLKKTDEQWLHSDCNRHSYSM